MIITRYAHYSPADFEGVREVLDGHRDQKAVRAALDGWYHDAKRAEWKTSSNVKVTRGRVSIISAQRFVFDIKGGGFRLIAAIDFEKAIVWIKWIGSHEDYDQIDARKVKYER